MIKDHCRPWEYCVILSGDRKMAVVAPQEPSCDYVRVVYDGHELAHWTTEDWEENLQGSVGLMLGVIGLINIGKTNEVMTWLRGDKTLIEICPDED